MTRGSCFFLRVFSQYCAGKYILTERGFVMNGKRLVVAIELPVRWVFTIVSPNEELGKDQIKLITDLDFRGGRRDVTGWKPAAKNKLSQQLLQAGIRHSEGEVRQ